MLPSVQPMAVTAYIFGTNLPNTIATNARLVNWRLEADLTGLRESIPFKDACPRNCDLRLRLQ